MSDDRDTETKRRRSFKAGPRSVDDVWEQVLVHLQTKSLAAIALMPSMPAQQTISKKIKADAVFASQVADARKKRALPPPRPSQFTDDIWEAFLALMPTVDVTVLCKRPGMPSHPSFITKMKRDPAFAARVAAIRSPNGKEWYELLEHLTSMSSVQACRMPGMPSLKAYYKRRLKNPVFKAHADAAERIRLDSPQASRRGAKPTPARWDAFIKELELNPRILEVCQIPGMPWHGAVCRKRRRDSAFDARVVEILGFNDLGRKGQRVLPERWDAFLEAIDTSLGLKPLCRRPEMPSFTAVLKKRDRDPVFAEQLATSVRRRRSTRIREAADRLKERRQNRPATGKRRYKRISEHELYAAVRKVIPSGLPPIARDDVICDMVLAVLDGELEFADLKKRASEFVREHWKMFGKFGAVSLDVPIWSDSGTTRGERVSGNAADYW